MKPEEKILPTLCLIGKTLSILPPLLIKLGLMKQCVKSLGHSEDCLGCVCLTFPGLSYEKEKAWIFDGPQIKTLLKHHPFVAAMTTIEARVWNVFADAIYNFLG